LFYAAAPAYPGALPARVFKEAEGSPSGPKEIDIDHSGSFACTGGLSSVDATAGGGSQQPHPARNGIRCRLVTGAACKMSSGSNSESQKDSVWVRVNAARASYRNQKVNGRGLNLVVQRSLRKQKSLRSRWA